MGSLLKHLRQGSGKQREQGHDLEAIRRKRMAEVRALLAEITADPGARDAAGGQGCPEACAA